MSVNIPNWKFPKSKILSGPKHLKWTISCALAKTARKMLVFGKRAALGCRHHPADTLPGLGILLQWDLEGIFAVLEFVTKPSSPFMWQISPWTLGNNPGLHINAAPGVLSRGRAHGAQLRMITVKNGDKQLTYLTVKSFSFLYLEMSSFFICKLFVNGLNCSLL